MTFGNRDLGRDSLGLGRCLNALLGSPGQGSQPNCAAGSRHAGEVTSINESSATRLKRDQFLDYTTSQLAPHEAVRGVVAIGSVATGRARPDSDIDAVVFLDPFDLHITPAESIWRPADDTYHSIFTDDPSLNREGLQLDMHRLDLTVWRSPDHEWPEHQRAELADGWILFDRTGEVEQLIRHRTSMPHHDRISILDDVLVQVSTLIPADPARSWQTLGSIEAFDRLQAAYEALAHGLFAYNGKWRPWRSRSLKGLLQLAYLPEAFSSATADAAHSRGDSLDDYIRRRTVLKATLGDLVLRLQLDRLYGQDPISEAFIRINDEPGRAWNMDEWNRLRHNRRG